MKYEVSFVENGKENLLKIEADKFIIVDSGRLDFLINNECVAAFSPGNWITVRKLKVK